MSAISSIDLALWDLKAKALEIPVWQLAGGMHRDTVRVYANGWFEDLTETVPGVPAETVARQRFLRGDERSETDQQDQCERDRSV